VWNAGQKEGTGAHLGRVAAGACAGKEGGVHGAVPVDHQDHVVVILVAPRYRILLETDEDLTLGILHPKDEHGGESG
jgi:hypothetical protein